MNRRRPLSAMLDDAEKKMLLATIKAWLWDQCRLRDIVRRPYAIMDGEVTTQDVVYHDPDAMR